MSYRFRGRLSQLDWPLLAFSIAVLTVYLFYTVSFVGLTPYPGIAFTSVPAGWQVNDSTQEQIPVDTIFVQIGDVGGAVSIGIYRVLKELERPRWSNQQR